MKILTHRLKGNRAKRICNVKLTTKMSNSSLRAGNKDSIIIWFERDEKKYSETKKET